MMVAELLWIVAPYVLIVAGAAGLLISFTQANR